MRQHLTGWRALLTETAPGRASGRQLLRELLAGPLTFTPEGRTYRFAGEAAVGKLLAGVVGRNLCGAPCRTRTCDLLVRRLIQVIGLEGSSCR